MVMKELVEHSVNRGMESWAMEKSSHVRVSFRQFSDRCENKSQVTSTVIAGDKDSEARASDKLSTWFGVLQQSLAREGFTLATIQLIRQFSIISSYTMPKAFSNWASYL